LFFLNFQVTHHSIIRDAGLKFKEYPYWDPKTRGLDFKGMCEALESAKSGSVILLHTCAHNPTGVDPTIDQWKGLAQIFKRRNLFPFFDTAYHGFATGEIENERKAIQIFLDEGLNMIVTYSFAKNFGLYGERIGALHVVCSNKDAAERVLSQLK
jgi:aspartate/tyrosine/aromatic aminotransferase